MQPFHPIDNATLTVSVTSSSSPQAMKKIPSGKFTARLHNALSEAVFYRFGDNQVVGSTTAGVPLPAGAVEVVTVENSDRNPITHVDIVSASGSGSVYVTTGFGL